MDQGGRHGGRISPAPGLTHEPRMKATEQKQPGDRDALFASLQKILEDCLTSSSGTKAESGK